MSINQLIGKYVESKKRMKDEEKIIVPVSSPSIDSVIDYDEATGIDLLPTDDGKNHTQDAWIKYFNDNKRIMVSMPDLYQAGKVGNEKLIEGLRNDFGAGFMSSTRIIYNKNDLNAKIIHYSNSNETKPIVSKELVIPVYRNVLLEDVLNAEKGLRFLQVLLGTNDNAEQIKDTLHDLSNCPSNKTKVWSTQDRKEYPVRAVLCYYGGGFHVNGNINPDNSFGLSRGVRIDVVGALRKIGSKK